MPNSVQLYRTAILSACCMAGFTTAGISASRPAPRREIVTSDQRIGRGHCNGRLIEATAGDSSKRSDVDRAKIVLCADKGASPAHTRAMVENTIKKLQENGDLTSC